MEMYLDELREETKREAIRYAANKIALEHQLAGRPILEAGELVRMAVQRIKAGSVNE